MQKARTNIHLSVTFSNFEVHWKIAVLEIFEIFLGNHYEVVPSFAELQIIGPKLYWKKNFFTATDFFSLPIVQVYHLKSSKSNSLAWMFFDFIGNNSYCFIGIITIAVLNMTITITMNVIIVNIITYIITISFYSSLELTSKTNILTKLTCATYSRQ